MNTTYVNPPVSGKMTLLSRWVADEPISAAKLNDTVDAVNQMIETTTVPPTTTTVNPSEPKCACCDGQGYQTRYDGIRVPCPGCVAKPWPVYPAPYVQEPVWPAHPQRWWEGPLCGNTCINAGDTIAIDVFSVSAGSKDSETSGYAQVVNA